MRSLLFITRKWEGFGGMQQLSRDLWRGMREMYEGKVKLCAPVLSFDTPRTITCMDSTSLHQGYGRQAGLTMTCKGAVLPVYRTGRMRMTHFLIISFLFSLRCLFLGIGAIVQRSHVHLCDATFAPLGWFLKKCGCFVTVTVCGLDVVWRPRWYQWILCRTLPLMDRVVCISRATAQEVRKRGVAEEKIVVIPCGMWVSEKKCRSFETPRTLACHGELCRIHDMQGCGGSKPVLLTIARLVPRKGIVWFLQEVMPRLLEWKPDLQYWIVGEGPEEERVCMTIAKMGLGKNVHLLKGAGDQELKERLDACSVLIVPNIPIEGDMEGFGIVCIEASLRGVPVVAARLEGLQDAVIEGETGVLFEPFDVKDCMRAMRDVIERQSFARDAVIRSTHEHFAWPFLFRRYLHEVFIF